MKQSLAVITLCACFVGWGSTPARAQAGSYESHTQTSGASSSSSSSSSSSGSVSVGAPDPTTTAPAAVTTTDATNTGAASTPAPKKKKSSVWNKLVANARYQQAKQNGGNPDPAAYKAASYQSDKPKPCKSTDSDTHLVDYHWTGPNCITTDASGKVIEPEEVNGHRYSGNEKGGDAARAAKMESGSCMTTGGDKTAKLVEECEKVVTGNKSVCNAQENTCDEIHKATQMACWGQGAAAPDFCLTKYQ